MKSILICPGERASMAFLAHAAPLVLVPMLGESILGYWLQHLAEEKREEVTILATDRPGQIAEFVAHGRRWGLRVRVVAEREELSEEEARGRYAAGSSAAEVEVKRLEALPGDGLAPWLGGYADWFRGMQGWLPRVAAMARIGMRQFAPGIWVGLRTQFAASTTLHAPCWLGDYVRVGAECILGPNTFLESSVVVDSKTEISNSWVGPETFVGGLTRLNDSLAWGNTLINWRTGSCTTVPDAFLLCALSKAPGLAGMGWSGRLLSNLARPLGRIGAMRGKGAGPTAPGP